MNTGPILDLLWVRLSHLIQCPGYQKKLFSLEMVENDICLGGVSKQNALFSENMPYKKHPCSQCLE